MSGTDTEQTPQITAGGRVAFISHSSIDKDTANLVCAALETNGYGCWIAPRDIVAGEHWSESIVSGLEECRAFVLIFSEHSHASEQVRREVHRAFEKHKLVVPLKIDSVVPTGSMEYYLGPVHWLTASNPPTNAELVKLVDHLRRGIAKEGGEDAPAASTAPIIAPERAAVGNLPEITSPYIGRVDMLADWETQLQSPSTRVMTLVGFGGMGKTRSALDLAHRVQTSFEDGAWWVELEEARTIDETVRKIAATLPIELQPTGSVEAQLTAYLKTRRMLLVLDNTEQIDGAGTLLNRLVKATETPRFLATSRTILEIPAERTIEVPPLPQEDAEALFIDRAVARQSTFERTEDNAADIADICSRLEGMPLAIELAATRVSSMTPHDILGRLGDWTKLLQTRAPHLPPRQRAIQGAIEWSHDLLNDDDKDLFAQLCVFANGFTLSTAEAVCDAFDVLESVHELRRHSFLRAQTNTTTQQMRFFMLELVRSFARQKLSRDDIQAKHATFFLDFAERLSGELRTRNQVKALDEVGAELDNLRAALETALELPDKRLCARLAAAMARPLSYLGFWTDAARVLGIGWEALDESLAPDDEPLLRARLRRESSAVQLDLGDVAVAQAHAEEARAFAQARADPDAEAAAENLIGLARIDAGDPTGASEHFTRALELWRTCKGAGKGMALHNLAMLASRRGERDEARALYEESLTVRRGAGDARGEAETLGNLGALEYFAGNLDKARDLYRKSLDIRTGLRDRFGISVMLLNLAEYYQDTGDSPRAVALYSHAEKLFTDLQSPHAAGPQSALSTLRASMGDDDYEAARAAGLAKPWSETVQA
ncbi:MAG: tetratricopeptide repeat protein [Capsulimonadaceae bacterium]